MIEGNENLSIEEVTSTVVESGIVEEEEAAAGGDGAGQDRRGGGSPLIPDKDKDPETYTLLALLVGEATPDYMVGTTNEYGVEQSGKTIKEAGEPNGPLVTQERAFTEMVFMMSVVINRMSAGGFGDRVSAIASNTGAMRGYKDGVKMLDDCGKATGASTARIVRARGHRLRPRARECFAAGHSILEGGRAGEIDPTVEAGR